MPTRRELLTRSLTTLAAAAAPVFLRSVGATQAASADASAARGATLAAYGDEAELAAALARWRTEAEKWAASQRPRRAEGGVAAMQSMQSMPAPAAPASALAAGKSSASVEESITNVQTAGVDEGGIVKRIGDFLVILRRGRLFTVRIGGDSLRPVATIDAFAPGSDPRGAWYDELLAFESTVVVVGYSYARGGTEIGLFDLSVDGRIRYRATYHLRSFDYYSSRNYASRLIGRKLIFYTPTLLRPWGPAPLQTMPGIRRWRGDAALADFRPILPATRVYRTDDEFDPRETLALHTVTTCDLGSSDLECESTAVLGPAGRVFYVSAGSVYVWTTSNGRQAPTPPVPEAGGARPAETHSLSAVFRIPLDGAAPTAIRTAGSPIDALSFLEDDTGHLNVLLRASGAGEGMWAAEGSRGPMALLRLPLAALGDGRGAARREHYRRLPGPDGLQVQNRFIGDWLVWGGFRGARSRPPGTGPADAPAWAVRYATAGEPRSLDAGHAVERIEALGRDAVLVGSAGEDLKFTSVRLGAFDAAIASAYLRTGSRQGEARTHGFFFRPGGERGGVLGLPTLERSGASVLYLRVHDLRLAALGPLGSSSAGTRDDACVASCVDWYGNARPIFVGERVFALLGYELVEGTLAGRGAGERIEERRRIDFAPAPTGRGGRYSPF